MLRNATPNAIRGALVILGDRALLEERSARIGAKTRCAEFVPTGPAPWMAALKYGINPLLCRSLQDTSDPSQRPSVIAMLEHASDACATGAFTALVTAPVQKSVIMDAGIAFPVTRNFSPRARIRPVS